MTDAVPGTGIQQPNFPASHPKNFQLLFSMFSKKLFNVFENFVRMFFRA
jgi:hypothetical protein